MSISKLTKAERAQLKSISGAGDGKFSDYDGDGYPDQFDCDPLDPNKDGILGDAWARISGASSRVQAAARRIYRPAAVSGREAVSTVYRRAYGAGAAARAATSSRISRAKQFVSARPQVRAAQIERGELAFVGKHTPSKTISATSRRIHEGTARIARVARGFEGRIDPKVRDVERALGFHSESIPKPVRWTGEQTKQLGYGIAFAGPAAAVEMAGMVPGGVETIARKPSILPAAATLGLFEMGRGMWHGATTAPGKTAGELIAMGAISKGVPKIPVPARVSRALPTRIKPPIELAPGKKIKFEAGLEVAQKLAKVEPLVKKPLDFGDIKTLPKGAGRAVETWIKAHPEQKSVIFGSGAARTQLKVSRKPGDIDIFMKDPASAAKQIHSVLVKKLGAENVSVGTAISRHKVGGHTVWTKVKGKWEHAVDIHARTEMTGRMTLGFETQKPIEIGGIEYTRIGEQLTRKAASILQQKGKTIGPPEKRAGKDIGDYMDISAELIESRTKAAESSWLLSEYKMGKAEHLRAMRREYEVHSYLGPEVAPAIRGYYGIPSSIRAPGYVVASAGLGTKYPGAAKYSTAKYPGAAKYSTAKYPGAAKYSTAKYPGAAKYSTAKYPGAAKYSTAKYPGAAKYSTAKYPGAAKYSTAKYPGAAKYPKSHEPYKSVKEPYEPYVPPHDPYAPPHDPYVPPHDPYVPPHDPYVPPPDMLLTTGRDKVAERLIKGKADKKKIKKHEAKPQMAAGWKQRHKLITLESLLGYKP